ncbi:hypothetical protein DFH05DRAFT_1460161 [Lentinula detonsa]|uniref:Uncharacterized protein n=1 Tax=Lentinula detonsa TaxID=2804962 RepID=A0A9W8TX26_9AGAR|nr:hypothetical protein DFH05DRAFT_1460161 [Lentinula detonsa]
MLWCFILALHLVLVNTLVITLPDVVVLKSTTTINFVTGSSDPSQWILRNVYANGTTQIGGTLSGTSSTTFAFQVTGTNGTAASQPFYTGDVFTPVDLSATSSTSQSPLTATTTQTVVSSSCPSLESAENATTETTNSTGTIVGSVIGGLGFSAALAFFLLWFNLRRQYKRLSRSAPSTLQIHNAPSTTPLMAPSNTYYAVQTTPHHSHSSSSDLAHPMVNPPTPLTPQRRSTKLAVSSYSKLGYVGDFDFKFVLPRREKCTEPDRRGFEERSFSPKERVGRDQTSSFV